MITSMNGPVGINAPAVKIILDLEKWDDEAQLDLMEKVLDIGRIVIGKRNEKAEEERERRDS
jgi:hypothetical protein